MSGVLGSAALLGGVLVAGETPAGAAVPPVVVTLGATSVGSTSATLNGTVNPSGSLTYYTFDYGTSTSYGLSAPQPAVSAGAGFAAVPVSTVVTGLTPGTTYDFQVAGASTGGVRDGTNLAFKTTGTAPIGAIPTVVTNPATSVTATTATLNGTVNPNGLQTSYAFQWGTSTSYGSTIGNAVAGSGTSPVTATVGLTGLTAGVTYDFRLTATNSAGGPVLGANQSFVAAAPGQPIVVTTAAVSVFTTSASVTGTVYPNGSDTTYYFEYGTTTAYGSVTGTADAGSGTTTVAVSASIFGLTAGATYDFQLVATQGVTTTVGGNQSVALSTPEPPTQIYGQDPIGTSIAISQAEFPTAGTAGGVVLARDDFFSDALAGGPLASSIRGPLLTTEGADEADSIDSRTLAEIQRVLPVGGTVYILGGDLAIGPNVDAQLTGAGYVVKRVAGANEYATAVEIAGVLKDPGVIFEVTGLYFADAASAIPAAIANGGAILLTDGNVQAPETGAYLSAHPTDTRYAIGGPLAAAGADPTATAIYGNDEYGTSAAVAAYFFKTPNVYGVATGLNFPDALSGGVYLVGGGRFGPMLLVPPNAPLPLSTDEYLATLPMGLVGYVFGGPLAIGASVIAALETAFG